MAYKRLQARFSSALDYAAPAGLLGLAAGGLIATVPPAIQSYKDKKEHYTSSELINRAKAGWIGGAALGAGTGALLGMKADRRDAKEAVEWAKRRAAARAATQQADDILNNFK